jgi:hypothetical protein
MAKLLKPPAPLRWEISKPSIFLAGSIEMGKAEDWQTTLVRALDPFDCVVLNPRRDEWDASWEQKITNPQFREQVEWELAAQEMATLIAVHFAPGTQAPITLLELGLAARTRKLIVCCPEGFWRKGNVDIVCDHYGIPMAVDLENMVDWLKAKLSNPS